MKKVLYVLTVTFIFAIVYLGSLETVFAEKGDKLIIPELEPNKPELPPITESVVPIDETPGGITIQATDFIKSAQVSIYDNGSYLKISGHTDSYTVVDKMTTKVYLQVWDTSRSRWIDYSSGKEFVKYSTNSLYNFVDYIAPKGYYYRTRGVHKVTEGSKTETINSYSSSIYYF
ncbi:hypothetical protein [Ferdinandcohnia sp. Marseille-Q9671]